MRVLLDTHIMLWWMMADRHLPKVAERIIKDADNEIYVSAASLWEISIKSALKQIDCNPEQIRAQIEPSGFYELPITTKHAVQVAHLPAHHRDPFDRMLVAQSLIEPMRLLTSDQILERYGATILLAG